tara:strand:+ start:291 stop:2357 length:2067 start_codon:yes stop_codon:yes gene_type:complete
MTAETTAKSKTSDTSAGTTNKRLFIAALVMSGCLTLLVATVNILKTELATEDYLRGMALIQTANDIRFYDEALTLSASMAAMGNTEDYHLWERRYNETVPLLEQSFRDATIPVTQATLASLSATNDQLFELELELFAQLAQGNTKQARALITGEKYSQLKSDYSEAMETLYKILITEYENTTVKIDQREGKSRVIIRASAFLTICIWAIFYRSSRRLNKLLDEYTEELENRAHFDQLTGIANRALFMDRLPQCFVGVESQMQKGALFLLDLDNFKGVNDNLGHPVGDKVLATVALRLTKACRASDTVARLGGDEFAIIAKDVCTPAQVTVLADKIVKTVQQPIEADGNTLISGVSVGVALYPQHADTGETLFRRADLALYRAKLMGKNQYAYFDEAIEAEIKNRNEIEADIRSGLGNGDFELYYQPIVRFSDQTITGVEALMRWNHPTRGLVQPDEFIPIAEESRLINPLGQWAVQEACRQHQKWVEMGLPPLTVSVNFSGLQFEIDALYKGVLSAVSDNSMDPHYLILEITESTLMGTSERNSDPANAIRTLADFSNRGIRIAIDDFGMGYSSLSRLKDFPIHILKVDRAFVSSLPDDRDDAAIIQAIVQLGSALGLEVVAEGIENQAQLNYLVAEGCDYGQGYLFARPLIAEQIPPLVADQREIASQFINGLKVLTPKQLGPDHRV